MLLKLEEPGHKIAIFQSTQNDKINKNAAPKNWNLNIFYKHSV